MCYYTLMILCSDCSVFLRPHSELIWWMKCPICGYTAFVLDEIHWTKKELALKNMYAKWDEQFKIPNSDHSETDPE